MCAAHQPYSAFLHSHSCNADVVRAYVYSTVTDDSSKRVCLCVCNFVFKTISCVFIKHIKLIRIFYGSGSAVLNTHFLLPPELPFPFIVCSHGEGRHVRRISNQRDGGSGVR